MKHRSREIPKKLRALTIVGLRDSCGSLMVEAAERALKTQSGDGEGRATKWKEHLRTHAEWLCNNNRDPS